MLGRRSYERFNLTASVHGTLSVLRDAIVHRIEFGKWIAISREAGVTGETFVLDHRLADTRARFVVKVVESRPIVFDGSLRHRLRLTNVESPGDRAATATDGPADSTMSDVISADSDVTAVLTRGLQARVINLSASGCLVTSSQRLSTGTIAALRVTLGGIEYRDDVQILRCQIIEGAGCVYHLGAAFLWTTPLHERSLRHVVARHALDDVNRPPRAMGVM